MAIDTTTPQSPGWWMQRLQAMLSVRQKRLRVLEAYLRGEPPLPREVDRRATAFYRTFLRHSRTNFAELIVEAVRERMTVTGFRTAAVSDDRGDDAAWAIWKANNLSVEAAELHERFLALGLGYAIVGYDNDEERPVITAEDPRQVATFHDPVQRQKVLAGLKLFHDDENDLDLAYLYLPGRVMVAGNSRKARTPETAENVAFSAQAWSWFDPNYEPVVDIKDDDLIEAQSLPAGAEDIVPVVEFRNKRARGEFEGHIDLLERINHTVLQRLIITAFQAFRQRAILGDLPDADPRTGEPIDYDKMFSADPGAFWRLPPNSQVWESGVVDLSAILNSVKADVEYLAAVTRTPMHYLTPGEASQSAEGASLQREGLVFKTEDRIARASSGWARVMSMALTFDGQSDRAELDALEPLWSPVERYSLAERGSASAQAAGALPWETLMEVVWQLSPEQLERARAQRMDDAALAPVLGALGAGQGRPGAPPAPPQPPAGGGGTE